MRVLLNDLAFAFRQLRKTPGFTITILLTLALGIGANAAIFTLVNAFLLQNLPVTDPGTLVRFGDDNSCCVNSGINEDGNYSLFSTETYLLFKKSLPEFQDLAAMESGFGYRPITVRREGPGNIAQSTMGEFVSGNYFRTFGLSPRSGRLFTDADDTKGAPFTAVMSYDTWQHEYAGDESVIGGTFWINTKPVTVVGIAPEGYFGDRITSNPPNFYLPLESMSVLLNIPYLHDPKVEWADIIGRLKPGASLPAVQAKVSTLLRQQFSTFDWFKTERNKTFLARTHVVLTPGGGGSSVRQEDYGSTLKLLTWIAALVLLVACANIANLLLVRSMSRRAEMSIRTALGAQRSRIVRQLLTESVLLAGVGGALGLAVAYGGARMLIALAFPDSPRIPVNAAPSGTVFAFAVGLSMITGILFGIAPAWVAAQAQPAEALRSGTRTTSGGASLLQRSLVILQAALSLVLLVGAGLFVQSLNKLETTDLHLDARNRYIVRINPQAAGYSQTEVEALYRTIEDRFHALPGVVKVGISTYTPLEDNNWGNTIQVQGQQDLHKNASWVKGNSEYFDSVGTHVVAGRGFKPTDLLNAPPIAVVNKEFVKQLFKPGENPIGHRFGSPGPETSGSWEIVGVVEDTAYTTVRWKDHAMYFVPITQRPANTKEPITDDISLYAGTLVIQTDRPVNDMEKLARETLSSINPNLTVVKFLTFSKQIADNFSDDRMIARLTSLFGAVALLLAAVGLYGVTSYTVVRRTQEIGIRMAMGARRSWVVGMVMRGALIQALIGLALGAPVAYLGVHYIKSQLYDITTVNAGVLAAAIMILAAAACVAGMVPARRAASIDPARALRVE
ncbi:MAG TPA: ABC transporter permease [Terracidiphilus sp.]|nr:ABC transporter permease [Terracidiphilus sp.]